jgi:hypothetical protein
MFNRLRRKLGYWLINLGEKNQYDFGDEVKAMYSFKGKKKHYLVVATKRRIFTSEDGEHYTEVKKGNIHVS